MKKYIWGLALVLSTGQLQANVVDSIETFIHNQQFSEAETEFINNNNMDVGDMLDFASNAGDFTDEFEEWLEDEYPEIYKKHVMNSDNFPNHPFANVSYPNGGLADTFRHMLWSAQIAKTYGYERAKEYTDLHEMIGQEGINKKLLDETQVEVKSKEWKYYKITTDNRHSQLKVYIDNLSQDVDLYVKKGSKPTLQNKDFDCRPYKGETKKEVCNLDLFQTAHYYIGVYGYKPGKFDIKAYLLDDKDSSDNGVWSHLTSMDYHNNYIGAQLGDENKNSSLDELSEKTKEFIIGKIKFSNNSINPHTSLPQNRPVIYKDFTNNSSRELMTFESVKNQESNDVDIEYFYNKYKGYFGSKDGNNYSCYTSYTCQNFTTGKKIAVHNGNKSLHYNYGSGWITWRNNY